MKIDKIKEPLSWTLPFAQCISCIIPRNQQKTEKYGSSGSLSIDVQMKCSLEKLEFVRLVFLKFLLKRAPDDLSVRWRLEVKRRREIIEKIGRVFHFPPSVSCYALLLLQQQIIIITIASCICLTFKLNFAISLWARLTPAHDVLRARVVSFFASSLPTQSFSSVCSSINKRRALAK